jgi:hypothetical protein
MSRAKSGLWRVVLGLLLAVILPTGATDGGGAGVGAAWARPGLFVRPGQNPGWTAAPAATGGGDGSAAALVSALWAGRASPAVPESLKPWVPWVLHDNEQALCPKLLGGESSEPVCAWPSRLRLELRDKGGGFVAVVRTYRRIALALPGSGKHWPQDVRVDGLPAVVLAEDGVDDEDAVPQVTVGPGSHMILGSFQWDELPESLEVPKDVGILTLVVGGNQILHPNRDDDGRVFLQKEEGGEEEEDTLDLTVHRKLTDGVPVQLTTRIELRVSGKRREVSFERALPEHFVPMRIDGPVPARLESTGTLRIQVRPGSHVITITARHQGPAIEVTRPLAPARWPADEAWVFEAQPAARIVTIEGVDSLDPQQTTLPDGWKKLPCYAVHAGNTVKLSVQRLGDSQPLPDELRLDRQIFLDFDGQGFTASDRITGTLHRAWRIEASAPTELGRVSIAGKDQLVTIGKESGRAGVELRQGLLKLSADSRIPFAAEISAVGWNADFHEVRAMLHLPPGWQLFHGSGADDIPDTWLRRYHLMSLFLTLLAAMGVWRLFGTRWSVVTLLGLLLACPVSEAPHVAVLAVLLFEALFRVLPEGRARSVVGAGHWLARVAAVLVVLAFSTGQLRRGLYPAVERPGAQEMIFDTLTTPPPAQQVQEQTKSLARTFARDSALGNDADSAMGGLVGAGPGGGGAAEQDQKLMVLGNIGRGAVQTDDPEEKQGRKSKPKMKLEKSDDLDALLDSGGRSDGVSGLLKSSGNINQGYAQKKGGYQRSRNVNFEFDPKAVVQTGPGLPRWSWVSHSIQFSGPVERTQTLRLWLIPPGVNLLLALLQVALLALLTVRLWGKSLPPLDGLRSAGPVLALVLGLGLLLSPQVARADLPSEDLLTELKDRLLKEPECSPHCASSSRMYLDAQAKVLRLRIEVSAAAQTAVPLPGSASQWLPEQVILDGVPATALSQRDQGRLYLVVPPGNHQILLEGRLPARPTVQIELPLLPRRVESHVEGWELAGVHEDGIADSNLQLSRIEKNRSEGPAQLQPGTLPPLVRVERSILIGMQWEVETRVKRLTPDGSAVVIEVPLLPGEQVTTADVRVQNRKALVNMAPGDSEFSWHGSLQETEQLELVAAAVPELTEQWRLQVSPMFHAELTGIPSLHPERAETAREPIWWPWPGEKVGIAVSRPAAKTGATLTIDLARIELRPGLRTTDATLHMRLRSSRGGQHTIKLPEGATVEALTLDGNQRPVQQSGRELQLQLSPGSQQFDVKWRQPGGQGLRFLTPEVDLGAQMVNVELNLRLGDGRWVLLCSGPRLGPAVLFWGQLVILIVLSLILGRVRFTPLRAQHWLLLGLGLLQVPLSTGAVVMGWFLAIGYRQSGPEVKHWALFDLRQLGLLLWTVMAMIGLAEAVRIGLTVCPEMAILGNGSQGGGDTLLRWYADRADGELPRAVVFSLPVLSYRLFMLLWSLLLAVSLVGYLPWAYRAFSAWGLWRPIPPLFRRRKAAAKSDDDSVTQAIEIDRSPSSDPDPTPDPK